MKIHFPTQNKTRQEGELYLTADSQDLQRALGNKTLNCKRNAQVPCTDGNSTFWTKRKISKHMIK